MDKTGLGKKLERILDVPKPLEKKIISQMKDYFEKAKRKTAIVGMSGGVDSSLVCYLSAKALGSRNVFAYYLPFHPDETDERDVRLLADSFGVNLQVIDIRRMAEKIAETIKPTTRISTGNIQVRTRMVCLYTFAHQYDGLVLGTGNKTEYLLGYFTKHGDGATDLLPLGDLYKTRVWKLADAVKIPGNIIDKVPSAGMWVGQTDEKELGLPYEKLDSLLASHFDLGLSWAEMKKYFPEKDVEKVKLLHESTEHKRIMPEIIKV